MTGNVVRAALIAVLFAGPLGSPRTPPGRASGNMSGNIRATMPNAVLVLTLRSWCGGQRTGSHQINGPRDPKAPTVYFYRTERTLRCYF